MKLPDDFISSETILLEKLDKVTNEVHHLKRANTKLKKEVRSKNRVIAKLKEDQKKKKQHFKNGRRGTYKNGG